MRTRKQMEARKRIEKAKKLPLMSTEDSDLKREQGLPRMDADERGSENQNLPLIHTETDQEGVGNDVAAVCGAKSTPIEVKMLKCTPIWDDLG